VEFEKGNLMAEVPLQLVFRGMGHSDAIERHVHRRAEKLATFFDRIVSCRTAVEAPHQHHRHGKRYRVRIELMVPGKDLVVSRNASPDLHQEDAHATVDDAFDNAERLLQDYSRKLRGDVKRQHAAPHGVVTKLFPKEGYGFLQNGDGAELYFHRNSVLDEHFDELTIGSEVLYTEELGEKGPQASSVRLRH
jgi:cold shock CspA family protein/ribosome-associated translation inhibitor RaiA